MRIKEVRQTRGIVSFVDKDGRYAQSENKMPRSVRWLYAVAGLWSNAAQNGQAAIIDDIDEAVDDAAVASLAKEAEASGMQLIATLRGAQGETQLKSAHADTGQ